MPRSGNIRADILQLWRSGHRLEAIKALHMQSGLGLKEAKEQLEASDLPDRTQAAGDRPHQSEPSSSMKLPASEGEGIPAEVRSGIEEAIARRDKIKAITLLRNAAGLGLAEAKGLIDAAMAESPLDWEHLAQRASSKTAVTLPHAERSPDVQQVRSDSLAPGEMPKRQGKWLWWLLIAMIALGIGLYTQAP